MAIVRTTKETNTSGSAPNGSDPTGAATPVDRTKSVVKSAAVRTPARTTVRRPTAPGAGQAPAKLGGKAFLSETYTELKRVVWPTTREVEAGTIVTIGLLIFFALYISALDIMVDKLFVALGILPK